MSDDWNELPVGRLLTAPQLSEPDHSRLENQLGSTLAKLADLSPRIQALRLRQEQLFAAKSDVEAPIGNRRVELSDLGTVVRYVANLRNVLSESSFAEQKAFIRSFVEEIKVTGGEAVLTYTVPMPPDETTADRVLDTIRNGGPLCTKGKTATVSESRESGATTEALIQDDAVSWNQVKSSRMRVKGR